MFYLYSGKKIKIILFYLILIRNYVIFTAISVNSIGLYSISMNNQQTIKKYGDIVRFHREKSGLNRAELAALANVGKTVIFDIEHSKISVRLNTLLKVLDILNIALEFKSPLMVAYKEKMKVEDESNENS